MLAQDVAVVDPVSLRTASPSVDADELLAGASFLHERLAGDWVRPAARTTEAGRRRFERWRRRLSEADVADALPGVSSETILRAFSGGMLVRPPPDPWATVVLEHLANPEGPVPARSGTAGPAPVSAIPYGDLFAGLVARAWSRHRSGASCAAGCSCSDAVLAAAEQATLLRLSQWLGPAVHQSFDRYRGARRHPLDLVLAAAQDPVPDTLHRSFLTACGPGGVGLWRRRPVLARLAAQLAVDDVALAGRILGALHSERGELHGFLGHDPGPLVELATGLGDRHGGGGTVSRLRFADETQLMYRPRTHHGLDVVRRVMASVTGTPLPPLPRQLDVGSHCWVEFVKAEPVDDLAAYHQATGALIAVLRAVGAADVHHENVIRTSTGPAVIDAEVVAHPVTAGERRGADQLADRVLPGFDLLDSVLHTGLLPTWDGTESGTLIDAAHLSPQLPGAVWVTSYRVFDRTGTDAEQLVVPSAGDAPRPDLPCPDYQPHLWSPAVVEGYRRAAAQLALGRRRPLVELEGVRIRFIARATRIYAEVLVRALRQPSLTEGVDLDLELDVLRGSSTNGPDVLAAELHDLRRLDIPSFDYEPVRDAFFHAGQRLNHISRADEGPSLPVLPPSDVERQISVLRGTLNALDGGPTLAASSCTELAHLVLDDLLDRRVRARSGRGSWLGSELRSGSTRFARLPVGWALYDGQPGIALALAAGAVSLGSDALADAAHAAAAPVLDRILDDPPALVEQLGVGYLSGAAGVSWAVRRLADLLDDGRARRAADVLEQQLVVTLLGRADFGSDELDLTSGVLGSLLVLGGEASGGRTATDELRGEAVRRLVRVALNRSGPETTLPGGMAHGWAGVALGLHRAAPYLVSDGPLAAAAAARAVEAAALADRHTSGLAWCSGRSTLRDHHDRPTVDPAHLVDEVPEGAPHHLCCGLVGSAVALSSVRRTRDRADDPGHDRTPSARLLATSVLDRLRSESVPRYFKALPAGLHQPGLMQGAAGLALGLLLLDGHPVPDPLAVL